MRCDGSRRAVDRCEEHRQGGDAVAAQGGAYEGGEAGPKELVEHEAGRATGRAAGLLLALLGARPIGVAAAAGLVLFFVGAIAAHLSARVYHNIAVPGGYLVLATGSLALLLVA